MNMKKILYGIVIGLVILTMGCKTVINSNKMIMVKSSCIGISIAENPATQLYEFKLGFIRNVFQMIPTSTNHIYAPNYIDVYDFGTSSTWGSPFSTTISEDTGTGDDIVFSGKGSVIVNTNKMLLAPKDIGNEPYRLGSRFQKNK